VAVAGLRAPRPLPQQCRGVALSALLAAIAACPPAPPATECSSDADCPHGHCDPAGHFCYLDALVRDGGTADGAALDGAAADSRAEAGPRDAAGDANAADGSWFDASCRAFGPVIQLALGSGSTCALDRAGAVKCWGGNSSGELGLGDTLKRGDSPGELGCRLPPVDLGSHRATSIAGGFSHYCAVLDDGTVRCWGYNAYGQLGYGNTNNLGDDELPSTAGDIAVIAP